MKNKITKVCVEGDKNRVFLKSDEGVFGSKGEGHISGSDEGLTALVLQIEQLKFIKLN